jgi:hypothetical protein
MQWLVIVGIVVGFVAGAAAVLVAQYVVARRRWSHRPPAPVPAGSDTPLYDKVVESRGAPPISLEFFFTQWERDAGRTS